MRVSAVATTFLAVVLALSGCAGQGPDASPSASPPTPSDTPPPSPSTSPSTEPSQPVEVFFAHRQATRTTVIAETHTVDVGAAPMDAVLAKLVSGAIQPLDPDYENLWGAGSELLSTSADDGILTVDLSPGVLSLGSEAEEMAIAQLVWTATALDPSVTAVQLTLDGAVAETLTGHVDITSPISPEPPENVLSPLQITSPAEGAMTTSPVVVSGLACVFEATFSWLLVGADGTLAEGVGMSSEACPARADWSVDLGDLAPGAYELTVIEYSMEDGSVASTDSKTFTVTG
jgi:spore germination protein GerM